MAKQPGGGHGAGPSRKAAGTAKDPRNGLGGARHQNRLSRQAAELSENDEWRQAWRAWADAELATLGVVDDDPRLDPRRPEYDAELAEQASDSVRSQRVRDGERLFPPGFLRPPDDG